MNTLTARPNLQIGNWDSSEICGVVERWGHRCGDDLVDLEDLNPRDLCHVCYQDTCTFRSLRHL